MTHNRRSCHDFTYTVCILYSRRRDSCCRLLMEKPPHAKSRPTITTVSSIVQCSMYEYLYTGASKCLRLDRHTVVPVPSYRVGGVRKAVPVLVAFARVCPCGAKVDGNYNRITNSQSDELHRGMDTPTMQQTLVRENVSTHNVGIVFIIGAYLQEGVQRPKATTVE